MVFSGPRRGLLVAVLGPDGAGKSTLIAGLEKRLEGAGWAVYRFHLRPGFGGETEFKGPITNPHAKAPRNHLQSVAKIILWWIDYVLGYWIILRPKIRRSGIVIFDRYYHDLLVDPRRYRYGSFMWLSKLVASVIPTPDRLLVLDVPLSVLRERKSEVSLEESRRQLAAYRELAESLPNARLINSGQSVEEMVFEAERVILESGLS